MPDFRHFGITNCAILSCLMVLQLFIYIFNEMIQLIKDTKRSTLIIQLKSVCFSFYIQSFFVKTESTLFAIVVKHHFSLVKILSIKYQLFQIWRLWKFCYHTFRIPHFVWNFLFNLLHKLKSINHFKSTIFFL